MNIQELPIDHKQSNGISVWQVHDYVNSLTNQVMGMQHDQAPPAEAEELIERITDAIHPMQIGKLIQVLKELESEIKILAKQTWERMDAIRAWNVPEDGEGKLIYDVRYPLPSNKEHAESWFNTAHPTIVNSTGKHITYSSGSSDYPSGGMGYDR
tara:strand:- start:10 stop:474 length:465 start_codon:yes stop_codon:yes gene_type:complete